ncbi:MAG TPA: type I glutamate--ammonia ligase, partial [Candidatus Binataceae bacterium]|nr:type I glutamate--ammonia ligase [Candidatus Binataceae bacterium]
VTPKQVLEMIREKGAVMVDLKFIDLLGQWQHFTAPISEFKDEGPFDEGLGFDGSSIRGWQAIDASDMLVIPDPDTAVMDPFTKDPTLTMICNISDPITRADYSRDPRNVARKAEAYLKSTGVGDTAFFGPEPEFFIFNGIRYDTNAHSSYHYIESEEGIWNSGKEGAHPNLGYKPRHKEGYFPVPPNDSLQDIRTEMVREMERVGIRVEKQHHEVATAGQAEIDMRFQSLVKMADWLTWYKYICKNVAVRHGMTATFMPKPIFGDNGSGMHTHQSIWKGETPLFAGNGYAGLSELGLHYIAGILHHAPALAAFTNPGTNSYRRLVPGFEAPINLAYSSRNRSAAVRIPMYSPSPKAKRIEVRFPDATCNPYLAFSAMLMAGLDGVQRRLDPGQPLDKDIYALTPTELADVTSMPAALEPALDNLKQDHEFLLKGDVFTADLIETWIDYKMSHEVSQVRLRPHPYEFALYFDA